MKISRRYLECNMDNVYIDAYIADTPYDVKRSAILIIPGGGYSSVCADREGYPIADAFIPYGFNAFILNYYVGREIPFPVQTVQAATAIKHIKDNADEYGIDPSRVFVIGFSAGGHLAACTATMWNLPEIYEAVGGEAEDIRPLGAMLMYPVISPKYHVYSFKNLVHYDSPGEQTLEKLSVDKRVTPDSAPAFILHSSDDPAVDVRNSLVYADACKESGVPFEMHIYPSAPHGIALGNRITSMGRPELENKRIAEWVRLAAEWAETVTSENV